MCRSFALSRARSFQRGKHNLTEEGSDGFSNEMNEAAAEVAAAKGRITAPAAQKTKKGWNVIRWVNNDDCCWLLTAVRNMSNENKSINLIVRRESPDAAAAVDQLTSFSGQFF